MVEIATKMILCLVIAAFIGFLIGFLIGRLPKKEKRYSLVDKDFKMHGSVYNRPIILSKPRPSGKDNLKEIQGIDLKIEKELNQLGIFHFDQIAKWTEKNKIWLKEYLELEDQIESENWVGQALKLGSSRNKV